MAAPKGNKFWECRSSHGRKPKFETPDDLWKAAVEYFEWVDENPLQEGIVYQGVLNEEQAKPLMRAMSLDAMQIFLDISDTCWYEYENREGFTGITNKIRKIIRSQKFEGAAAGLLNPNIIARDLGLSEKQDNTHSGPNGGPIQQDHKWRVEFVNATPEDKSKA